MIGANDCTIYNPVGFFTQKGGIRPSKVIKSLYSTVTSCHSLLITSQNPTNEHPGYQVRSFLGSGSETGSQKPPQMHRPRRTWHFVRLWSAIFCSTWIQSNVNEGSRRSHMTYEYIFPIKKQKWTAIYKSLPKKHIVELLEGTWCYFGRGRKFPTCTPMLIFWFLCPWDVEKSGNLKLQVVYIICVYIYIIYIHMYTYIYILGDVLETPSRETAVSGCVNHKTVWQESWWLEDSGTPLWIARSFFR